MKKLIKTKSWLLCACLWLAGSPIASARTIPDASNPLGFFTTVADKMLRSTFSFGVTNIPVCSNGVYVYTPAVQRLLQLSANLYDASNTNFFPTVFRPLFGKDASNNLFIVGYEQVTNVSGPLDSQLSPPYDFAALLNFPNMAAPLADSNGPVNVYGVPWIIGAKKGLPNFNQLAMVTAAQVTRKLEVTRPSVTAPLSAYTTNQMYVLGISNSLAFSFWNSYDTNYPDKVRVYVTDAVQMSLTNDDNGSYGHWSGNTNFYPGAIIPSWPGSQWSTRGLTSPNPNSFFNANWGFYFINLAVYRYNGNYFDPIGSPTVSGFETTTPPLPQLPPFGLEFTNYVRAFILDGSNVIDYVQFEAPVTMGNLNQALADPIYPDLTGRYYQWSTNTYPLTTPPNDIPYGVINQLWVSGHPGNAPASGGKWSTAPTPMGITTPDAEAAYYRGFFMPTFQYNGQIYVNNQLSIQAPYTPTRTVYSAVLMQANDPLVHYLASDLDSEPGSWAVWGGHISQIRNGYWYKSDDPLLQPLPSPPSTPIGGRYQHWMQKGQMDVIAGVIPVTNNYAAKDPLVYRSDNWNFPSNLLQSLDTLGQVHRGTPWQTFYLKDADLTKAYTLSGGALTNFVGTNTWVQWTADFDPNDAMLMAPVNDRQLAGLLISLLNTNDPTQLFSVNDPNLADWQNFLNGLTVYSNSAPFALANIPLTFDTSILDGASPQAVIIANGIAQARANQSGQNFDSIGDVLLASELSAKSPFLNLGSNQIGHQQMNYGIADWEYEAIPAQLLPRLRPDSIGALTPAKGGWNLSFSGADGYVYVLQTSTNLVDWNSVSTNCPVQGSFKAPIAPAANSLNHFYRSVLLP